MTVVPVVATMLFGLAVWRVVRTIVRSPQPCLDRPIAFLALIALVLGLARWPSVMEYVEYNPDESQIVAQAALFLHRVVPWRDVDGTTSGPLNSLVLTVPLALGAPMSWATARLALVAARLSIIAFLYLAIRPLAGDLIGRAAVLPLVAFYVFTLDPDFSHFSSETVPSVLFSGSAALLASAWVRGASGGAFYLVGTLLGAIPIAKLQAAPLAATLGIMAVYLAHQYVRRDGAGYGRMLAVLAGLATPSVLVLLLVAANGVMTDMWISYVLSSIAYIGPQGVIEKSWRLLRVSVHGDAVRLLSSMALGLGVSGIAMLTVRGALSVQQLLGCVIAALAVVVALYCAWAPGYAFPHYLNLTFPPLILLSGLSLGTVWQARSSEKDDSRGITRRGRWIVGIVLVILMLPASLAVRFVVNAGLPGLRSYHPYPYQEGPRDGHRLSATAEAILAVARPGEPVAIWGWMPGLYVETSTIPGTRDAVAGYAVGEGPFRYYYRQRFLADLTALRPPIFVDAVAGGCFVWIGWPPHENLRYDSFPDLREHVAKTYVLLREVHQGPDGLPVRLFVLRERAERLGANRRRSQPAALQSPVAANFRGARYH